MTDPTPETTPTRDGAVREPAALAAFLRISSQRRDIPESVRQQIIEAADLLSAPAPASGRVDAVWKALDTANHVFHFDLRHMIEWGDDYNQAVKDASDRVAAALASLSPAATPGSEAGGELHHVTGERITRKDLNNAHRMGREEGRLAAELLPTLAKPASSPAGGDVDQLRAALQLAKDMFIANNLSLPHTFEVIDAALSQSTSAGRAE